MSNYSELTGIEIVVKGLEIDNDVEEFKAFLKTLNNQGVTYTVMLQDLVRSSLKLRSKKQKAILEQGYQIWNKEDNAGIIVNKTNKLTFGLVSKFVNTWQAKMRYYDKKENETTKPSSRNNSKNGEKESAIDQNKKQAKKMVKLSKRNKKLEQNHKVIVEQRNVAISAQKSSEETIKEMSRKIKELTKENNRLTREKTAREKDYKAILEAIEDTSITRKNLLKSAENFRATM